MWKRKSPHERRGSLGVAFCKRLYCHVRWDCTCPPEVELLPLRAWRLYPVSFRMLHVLVCTLPAAVQPQLPEGQARDAPTDKLQAALNAWCG